MQNHGGYSQSTLKGYEPDVKLNYETEYPEAQTYLSLARESDKAFQNLVEYLKGRRADHDRHVWRSLA